MMLMLAIIHMAKAQQAQLELTEVKSEVRTENFKGLYGGVLTSSRLTDDRIDMKQEVYWPLGVNYPLFQIDEPVMVYLYIDKPQLDDLSDEVKPVAINSSITSSKLLPAFRNQSNFQDNLAPSIQITF